MSWERVISDYPLMPNCHYVEGATVRLFLFVSPPLPFSPSLLPSLPDSLRPAPPYHPLPLLPGSRPTQPSRLDFVDVRRLASPSPYIKRTSW